MILAIIPFPNPFIPSSFIISLIVLQIPLYFTQLFLKQAYSQFILLTVENSFLGTTILDQPLVL